MVGGTVNGVFVPAGMGWVVSGVFVPTGMFAKATFIIFCSVVLSLCAVLVSYGGSPVEGGGGLTGELSCPQVRGRGLTGELSCPQGRGEGG